MEKISQCTNCKEVVVKFAEFEVEKNKKILLCEKCLIEMFLKMKGGENESK